ncbi:MAG: ABC transporter ATP-binding protein [Thermoproteota archaeon]
MPKVVLEDVSKRFGNIVALDNVRIFFEDGEYSCILGPTGSGKTTLLKIVAGLVKPDTGSVYIDGERVNEVPPEKRNAVYMHQSYALFPHMTVGQNILFGLIARGFDLDTAMRRVMEVLEIVRLGKWADAYPKELSGGMQQRVALARCLATGAKILLLDEPLGSLDARLRLEVRKELARIAEELNLTVIHVTHDQSEAMALAQRIVILRNGRIIQAGSPEEVYFNPNSIFSAYFVGESIFLEGVINRVNGDIVSIRLRNGMVLEAYSREFFNPGELAVISFCSCNLVVGKGSLMGTLKEINFFGSTSRLVFELPGGIRIYASLPLSEFVKGDFRIETSFHLDVPRERIHVFKYPAEGLEKEIKAI